MPRHDQPPLAASLVGYFAFMVAIVTGTAFGSLLAILTFVGLTDGASVSAFLPGDLRGVVVSVLSLIAGSIGISLFLAAALHLAGKHQQPQHGFYDFISLDGAVLVLAALALATLVGLGGPSVVTGVPPWLPSAPWKGMPSTLGHAATAAVLAPGAAAFTVLALRLFGIVSGRFDRTKK